ncbi:F-box protein CPR1-like [Impatiens glandulifera]|uniref:F-box protein CPR1-like n=1 Tax=Impatiens glandulifera TaxID=253017 RepID=UPI001FB14234|nr:F-box protein CPR1-like [Impatiens glandulifera]
MSILPNEALKDNENLKRCNETRLLIAASLSFERSTPLYYFSLEGNSMKDDYGQLQLLKVVNHPLVNQLFSNHIWGSANGLVCISNQIEFILNWNPSSRMSEGVTVEVNTFGENLFNGFGRDRWGDSYKPEIIHNKDDGTMTLRDAVDILSIWNPTTTKSIILPLRSKSWHKVKKFENDYPDNLEGSGITNYSTADLNFYSCLASLGGCLSLTCHHYSGNVDVWLLKEYGGMNESWSRIITIPAPRGFVKPVSYSGPRGFVKPVSYSKCDKKVLINMENCLTWYNLQSQMLERPMNAAMNVELKEMTLCLETLVSVDG